MNNLIKVLTTAKKLIEKNPVLPIYENFYSDGKTVQSSNVDMFFKVYHDARFKGGINPNQLLKILELEPTEIEQNDRDITFRNGGKKVSLILDMEDFPTGPEIKENIILNDVKTEPFFKSLHFLCKDELRMSMTCFYFGNKDSSKIEICATDAHKLFRHNTQMETRQEFETLISKKTIEMLKSLKVESFDLVIGATDKRNDYLIINFFAYGYLCEIVQRVVDARYPDYNRVIPQNDINVNFHKKELLSALSNCAKFGNKTSNKFILQGDEISSEDLDFSTKYSEKLTVEPYDETLRGFNIKNTTEVINSCDSDIVKFSFSDSPSRGAIIKDGNDLFLLMPVVNNY
jgi:DNA polymerase III sliding clamp (beta) subunit (PCNA family)